MIRPVSIESTGNLRCPASAHRAAGRRGGLPETSPDKGIANYAGFSGSFRTAADGQEHQPGGDGGIRTLDRAYDPITV
jgi:hypothetical protein